MLATELMDDFPAVFQVDFLHDSLEIGTALEMVAAAAAEVNGGSSALIITHLGCSTNRLIMEIFAIFSIST